MHWPYASDTIQGVKRLRFIPLLVIQALFVGTLAFGPIGSKAAFAVDNCQDLTGQAKIQCQKDQAANPAVTNPTGVADCPNGGVRVSVGSTGTNQCVGSSTDNPILAYAKMILLWLSGLVGVVISIAYMVAGYQWMTSAGSPDKLKKAKLRLAQATVSLLLFIFMAAILRYLIPNIF